MNRSRKWALILLATPLVAIALFLLAAWVGSAIPRNGNWTEPQDGVEILIETNGVHTAIVMPLVSIPKDWRNEFPAADLREPDRPYTHVSISWGNREVFLGTPTWADLKPSTAFHALVGGDALIHVAHYVRPAPGRDIRPLRISAAQYARLVAAIERQLLPSDGRRSYPGYFGNDIFYDAPGRYHIGNTCNQWTGDTLAGIGVKMGLWTPFAGGVMRWIPYSSLDKPS